MIVRILLVLAALFPVICAGPVQASKPMQQPVPSVLPPYTQAYASATAGSALISRPSLSPEHSLRLFHESFSDPDGHSARPGGKSFLPVLYSLLVPGAGEIALGYWKRGIGLIAAEATAWTGYGIYHSDGLDGRKRFESFADAHWDHDAWLSKHLASIEWAATQGIDPSQVTFEQLDAYGRSSAWGSKWPGYHTYFEKAKDKQNYYENIGKYDWFVSGWEDWDANAADPINTPLRVQYRALRKQSNDDLDTAERFIFLSIAARVFSLVETVILVTRDDNSSQAKAAPRRHYRFTMRATGRASSEVALEVRFR